MGLRCEQLSLKSRRCTDGRSDSPVQNSEATIAMEQSCIYFVRHPVHEELYLGEKGWTAVQHALIFLTREAAIRAAFVQEGFVIAGSIDLAKPSEPVLRKAAVRAQSSRLQSHHYEQAI